MIFYARATRGRGLPSLDARSGRPIQAAVKPISPDGVGGGTSEFGRSMY